MRALHSCVYRMIKDACLAQLLFALNFQLTHWPLGNLNGILDIFKHILVIDEWGISCEIALIWMSLDFTDDQSTLVAWRQQAITWANVDQDLCRHMASLGYNELKMHWNWMV